MINEVYIKNFALIDELNISFHQGLNILTGETGAGKSIIIGAMNALNGERINSDMIKTGEDYAYVEISFIPNELSNLLLEEYDISDDDFICLSRKIMNNGRSAYKINGEKCSVKQMKSFFPILLDIHSQREHSSLLKKDQCALLDSFVSEKDKAFLEYYSENYKRLKEIEARIKKDNDGGLSAREAELLKFEIDEIESLYLQENEDNILESEYNTLSNAKTIIESLYSLINIFEDDNCGINSGIAEATSVLSKLSNFNDELEGISNRSIDAQELFRDLSYSIKSYADNFELDDERLEAVSARLGEINKLKSKYKSSVNEIFEILDKKQEKYDFLVNYKATRESLEKERSALLNKLKKDAAELTIIRKSLAETLSRDIEGVLADLNLENCKLEIRVSVLDALNDLGENLVEIYVSTNKNEPFKPIYDVASGGELSRIMLAVKSAVSKNSDGMTMIFDEIDTGISGRTASKVAMKIDDLSSKNQIICITHLAQIAAFSDQHYLIEKSEKNDKMISEIRILSDKEKEEELARLIGGISINDATIVAAKDILSQAQRYKKGK